ncbi:hypothetical protein NQ318_013848 [Aromia moschata]|uniref:Aminopeptidase n=1 Tax=Aromia moschata TaxID=1265417 RepID=A0AAV8ZBN2_9CUCU|nr:hypothetical protein NQ318_013848 [Aromia moschata]
MALLHLISFVLMATAASAVPTKSEDAAAEPKYRLPQIYDVQSYDLSFSVPSDVFTGKSDTYDGTVAVQFKFTEAAGNISMHADPDFITLTNVTFNNIALQPEDYSIDNVTDILTIVMVKPVTAGNKYMLEIKFAGKLSTTDMYGFYRSSYKNKTGDTKYLATTQFEPAHARRAFPCFDEPGLKATFDVKVDYPSGQEILFNTKVYSSSTDEDAGDDDRLQDYAPMPTYLVALVISEFTCTSGATIDNTTTSQVCSRDETKDLRDLAVDVGPKFLNALSALTGYNYSNDMSKMDQVAIPDFAPGAMENWALVTYREADLLFDKNESSNRHQQSIATTISHEFTHQWFGDLVTCNWWSEIFLNEGFATYFQYFIAHEVFPEWELDKQFVIEKLHSVLDADESSNAQALQSECSTPTEIGAKFGDISYDKGASIIRMVSHILGHENFVAGLRTYLVNNQHKTATPENLWDALATNVDNTISKLPNKLPTVMESWIKKSGSPLLTVTTGENNEVIVTQEPYGDGHNGTQWYVPVSYTTSTDKNKFESTSPMVWVTPDKNSTTISLKDTSSWIVLNNQESGYYRVNYDETLWGRIKQALSKDDFDGIVELNRAQIVDDLFSLAKNNKTSYENVFSTIEFLEKDRSYYSWYAATNGYDFLLTRVGEDSKLGQAISMSLMMLMDDLYDSLPLGSVNDTDQIGTLKQVLAYTWMCRVDHTPCINDAKKLFSEYKQTNVRPDKNLRSFVYCNALKNSDDADDWKFLWDAYTNASDLATERSTIISALGCTRYTSTLTEYLNKTITDDSGIRLQDAASVFSSVVTGTPEGVDVAFAFLVGNYQTIEKKYKSMNSLSSILTSISERFTTQEQVDKLKEFIEKKDLPAELKSAGAEALEVANSHLAWREKFEEVLLDVFDVSSAIKVTTSVAFVLVAVVLNLRNMYIFVTWTSSTVVNKFLLEELVLNSS